jgi:hypothetical protein
MITSTALGQADREKLNHWLHVLFGVHIEAGISAEPQVVPEIESTYITV